MTPLVEIREMIKDKLELDISDLAVEIAPDKWADYNMDHPTGAILINYGGRRWTSPSGEQQTYNLSFTLILCLRSGYNSSIGLQTLERVRQSMTNGLYIDNLPFWISNEEPLGEDEGIWYWGLDFITYGVMMQGE